MQWPGGKSPNIRWSAGTRNPSAGFLRLNFTRTGRHLLEILFFSSLENQIAEVEIACGYSGTYRTNRIFHVLCVCAGEEQGNRSLHGMGEERLFFFPIRVASFCKHNFSYKHIGSLDLRAKHPD